MKFRPILLAWLLLLGATLAMGAGAWWLLNREADRVEAMTAGAMANGAASVAENVDLLMEEIRNGVTVGMLASRNAPNPKSSLAELTSNNPYVGAGFFFRASDGVASWYGERGNAPSPTELKKQADGQYPWSLEAVEAPEAEEISAGVLNLMLQDAEALEPEVRNAYAPTDIYENFAPEAKDQLEAAPAEEVAQAPQQFEYQAKSQALKQQRANVRKVIILGNSMDVDSDEFATEGESSRVVALDAPQPISARAKAAPAEPNVSFGDVADRAGAASRSVRDRELASDAIPPSPTTPSGYGLVIGGFGSDFGNAASSSFLQSASPIQFLDYQERRVAMAERERQLRASPARHGWISQDVGGEEHWMAWADLPESRDIIGAWLNRDAVVAELAKTINISQLKDVHFTLVDDAGRAVAGARPEWSGYGRSTKPELVLPVGTTLPGWRIEAYPALGENPFGRSFRLLGGMAVAGLSLAILLGGSLLLWQAQRDARDAQRKTTFVANVSHELKTPLTSIRLFAEMLHDGRAGDETKQRRYLQTMLNETQRLTRLVNNVLDFSRLERGRRDFQADEINLGDTVGEIIEAQRERLQADGLALEFEEPVETIAATIDRDALEQILLNLLDNAAKYASSGERAVIRLALTPSSWKLSVSDFGPGIPAAERRQVFEAFHRMDDRLTAERPGCGLGLSIAARLAHGLGGQLTLRDNQPHGCCFELQAPLNQAS